MLLAGGTVVTLWRLDPRHRLRGRYPWQLMTGREQWSRPDE
jgi:hypothetical protein